MATASEKPEEKLRKKVTAAAGKVITEEYLVELLELAKEMTKGYRTEFDCPKCGFRKIVVIQAPDVTGQFKTVSEILEHTEGRVATESGDAGVILIVERKWPVAGAEDLDELHSAAAAGSLPHIEG